jgi:hypothetical protein
MMWEELRAKECHRGANLALDAARGLPWREDRDRLYQRALEWRELAYRMEREARQTDPRP